MSEGLGLRKRLADVLDRAGALEAILAVRRKIAAPWLTVLTYHRVIEKSDHGFDPEVVDATPDEFDRQLGFFARHFTFVDIDDVLDFLQGKPLPPSPLLVTFDDGYRDNHDVALPIL